LIQNNRQPLLYLITDRTQLPANYEADPLDALTTFLENAIRSGVDMVQLRERDLSAWTLYFLTKKISSIASSYNVSILINDRADIAAACGVGVHLTTRSLPVAVIRKRFGDAMLIGASTHSLAEAQAASDGGANFIVFGPVFETISKKIYGEPVGLAALSETVSKVSIPVLALGGIKLENYSEALQTGAAGIAAISLFTGANDLPALIKRLKAS
jgi:thiamine-phosphate pyrophosphorylase